MHFKDNFIWTAVYHLFVRMYICCYTDLFIIGNVQFVSSSMLRRTNNLLHVRFVQDDKLCQKFDCYYNIINSLVVSFIQGDLFYN